MSTFLIIPPKIQFLGVTGLFVGLPLAGGKLYTAMPGTTAGPAQAYPKASYTDSTGSTPNANPVILDSQGMASVWLNGYYSMALYDANGVLQYSANNVSSGQGATPLPVVSKIINYAMQTSDANQVFEFSSGSAIAYTLLAASAVPSGSWIKVKNIGAGVLTITGTVDGTVNPTLSQYDEINLFSDGVNWYGKVIGTVIWPVGPISGVNMVKKDDATITISGFTIEIGGVNYTLGASTDKAVSALTASTWYYLFAQAPGSGTALSATEITYSATPPTYDHAKEGWYTSTKRCFGVFYSDASSKVEDFVYARGVYSLNTTPRVLLSTGSPATTATLVGAGVPALGKIACDINLNFVETTGVSYGYLENGDQSSGQTFFGHTVTNGIGGVTGSLLTNSSQQIKYWTTIASSLTINLSLWRFYLPGGF